jgi:hypothetical protein
MPSLMATSLRWRKHSARTNYVLRREANLSIFSGIFVWIYLKQQKSIFGGCSRKYESISCALCKITAPTDKMFGNESKNPTTSQNYRLFQCIFPIFHFFIKFEGR